MQSPSSARNSPRGIFCSRTLNLRSISAIGYDMDYTLMHYNVMVIIFLSLLVESYIKHKIWLIIGVQELFE